MSKLRFLSVLLLVIASSYVALPPENVEAAVSVVSRQGGVSGITFACPGVSDEKRDLIPSGATSWSGATSASAGSDCDGNPGSGSMSASMSFTETHASSEFVSVSGNATINASATGGGTASGQAQYRVVFDVSGSVPYAISTSVGNSSGTGTSDLRMRLRRIDTNGNQLAIISSNFDLPFPSSPIPAAGTIANGRYDVNFVMSTGAHESQPSSSIAGSFSFRLTPASTTLSISDAVETEGHTGTKLLRFPVSLSSPATGTVSVSYGTQDLGTPGSAQAGSDYTATFGTLNFSTGESQKFIDVPLIGDVAVEPNETFRMALLSATGATIADGTGIGTIINDDVMSFDWTVPARFGADGNGDGKLDYFPPDGTLQVNPSGWPTHFTLTGPCNATNTINWFVDGVQVQPGDARIIGYDPHSCLFKYQFPSERKYSVKVEVRDGSNALTGSVTNDVTIQDWLIVSIGDSVGSGEGNPDVPGGAAASWENTQCHRSSFAGSARAALAIEMADPKTSVTFIHLACSGATIDVGLLGSYEGQVSGSMLPPQMQQLRDRIGTRELDALLVSIGANDVEFASIVTRCLVRPLCHEGVPGSAANLFETKIAQLPGAYGRLRNSLTSANIPSSRVYISEYFDPTRDGAPCADTILGDHPIGNPTVSITASEAAWASNVMLPGLNAAVANAASTHGWKFVGGITSQFVNHGYCATDHWVVRWTESQAQQGNEDGSLHPNRRGHQAYGERIGARLTADLYIGGNLLNPRPPQ
jgi:hypothetical protein